MKRTSAVAVVLGLLLLILVVAGCHNTAKSPETSPSNSSNPQDNGLSGPSVSNNHFTAGQTKSIAIYVKGSNGADDNGLVSRRITVSSLHSPAKASVRALINSRNSPIPAGTQLRSIKIANGIATVDFSAEFQTNFHGGDTQEAQAINSILMTLGQFNSIQKVQILVNGKRIDALSQLAIDEPLDVIRPGAPMPLQAADSGSGG